MLRRTIIAILAAIATTAMTAPGAAYTPVEAKAPMTETLVRSDAADCGTHCAEWLSLTGVIGPDSPARLKTALDRLHGRKVPILVDSPGGAVEPALAMGRMIRARKLDVVVAATGFSDCAASDRACAARLKAGERSGYVAGTIAACASACVLVLAGGTVRSVGHDSYVGVHQMITKQTFRRVINTFRVIRRRIGNRVVEVSRTLIATRPVSSRTVQKAAPEALYVEVDRYLIGMGIGESIMPLMHATPPTAIHWMTPAEIASTAIATDATDAQTFVARSAEPAAAAAGPSPTAPPSGGRTTAALSTLARSDPSAAVQPGTVLWRVDRSSSSAAAPSSLGAEIDIPGRKLKATLTVTPETGANLDVAATVHLRFDTPPDGVGTLVFRDQEFGADVSPLQGEVTRAGTVFTVPIPRAEWTAFMDGMGSRSWLVVPLMLQGRKPATLVLNLDGGGRDAIRTWLAEAKDIPPPPKIFQAPPPSRAPVAYVIQHGTDAARPVEGTAEMTWIPITPFDSPAAPGMASLVGTLDIPAAGLHLMLQFGLAKPGSASDAMVEVSAVPTPSLFGPIRVVTIPPFLEPGGRTMVLVDRVDPIGGGYALSLSFKSDIPDDAHIKLELFDALLREIDVDLPLDGPLGAVLKAARQARGPAG